MLLAAILSLLPASWVRWQRGITQLLGPPQWALSATSRAVREAVQPNDAAALSGEQAAKLRTECDELRRLVVQQGAWLDDLEKRYEVVSGLSHQLGDATAKILIAPVWAYDASPRRETLLIGRGLADGVVRGSWVAAGAAADDVKPDESGRQTLMRQWLIGRVSEVQPYESRVVLASDPKFGESEVGERVCLGKILADGRWQSTPARYVLSGVGRGKMVIRQADADYWNQGYLWVLVPAGPELPATLTIGRITGSERLAESALHYDLRVEGWLDPRSLNVVYVILVGR